MADLRVERSAVGRMVGYLRPVGKKAESADRLAVESPGMSAFPAVEIPAVHPAVEILVVGNQAARLVLEIPAAGNQVAGKKEQACIPSVAPACK